MIKFLGQRITVALAAEILARSFVRASKMDPNFNAWAERLTNAIARECEAETAYYEIQAEILKNEDARRKVP